jgi:AcrR family transcriptional regulator
VSAPRGRDEVRSAVLDAAAALFAQHGPSRTSTRDIAQAAGVNRGLLHRHFGSKEELVAAVVARGAAQLADAVGDADSVGEIVDRLFELGEGARGASELLAQALADGMHLDLAQHGMGILDRLAGVLGGDDRRYEAAVFLAALLGWQLFSDALLATQGLAPDPQRGRRTFTTIGEALVHQSLS